MPREYRHIKDFEKEIEELRKEGYSSREIGIKFGFSYKQMRNYFYRHNVEQRKIAAGAPIKDILTNGLNIPGSKAKYSQNTFITKDGLSPNLLGGYIQTLMVYCTITGKSAVGQPYEYIMDMSLAPTFDIPGYVVGFYANGYAATNFPEILQSPNEMKCLQMKVDEYLLNN